MEGNWDFADASFLMKWTSQSIELGRTPVYCRGWQLSHPGNFDVILKSFWNDLEKYQKQLNAFYNGPNPNNRNKCLVKDDPSFMLPSGNHTGLYVVAFIRHEWHRACIVDCGKKTGRTPSCVLILLDYGEQHQIPYNRIRRIPKHLLSIFPAQAIKCSLEFKGNSTAELNPNDYKWTGREAGIFRQIMQDCRYAVEFERYEVNYNHPNPLLWYCKVWLLHRRKPEATCKPRETNVLNIFINALSKKFNKPEASKGQGKASTAQQKSSSESKQASSSLSDPWENLLKEISIKSLENCVGLNVFLEEFSLMSICPSTHNVEDQH